MTQTTPPPPPIPPPQTPPPSPTPPTPAPPHSWITYARSWMRDLVFAFPTLIDRVTAITFLLLSLFSVSAGWRACHQGKRASRAEAEIERLTRQHAVEKESMRLAEKSAVSALRAECEEKIREGLLQEKKTKEEELQTLRARFQDVEAMYEKAKDKLKDATLDDHIRIMRHLLTPTSKPTRRLR